MVWDIGWTALNWPVILLPDRLAADFFFHLHLSLRLSEEKRLEDIATGWTTWKVTKLLRDPLLQAVLMISVGK